MPIEIKRYRIVITDDHPITREGIASLLRKQPEYQIVATASTGAELLSIIASQPIDILFLDISLPDISGLELLKIVKEKSPATKVIILSMFEERIYAFRCFRAGAEAYINKNADPETILTAVATVAEGKTWIAPEFQNSILEELRYESAHHQLSDREFEILLRLARGERTGEIAEALHLNIKTVSTYRRRILEKLGLKNNAQLIDYARSHNLI